MCNLEILRKFIKGSPLLQRENSLLGSQNTTRRLPSTFPQIVFSSKAGFTFSLSLQYKLHSVHDAVRYTEDVSETWLIYGCPTYDKWETRKERGRNEGKEEREKERSKERMKMARKIQYRLREMICVISFDSTAHYTRTLPPSCIPFFRIHK